MKASFERDLSLRHSPNATERESIRFATLLADGAPLLVHLKSLSEHLYIRGSSGSGKSAMLAYLVEIILSPGNCILHFLNIKDSSSMDLFAAILAAASRSGMRVKWFVDQFGKSTHTFNLFKQAFWLCSTPMQKAGLIGAALGSTHGLSEYGPQFYGGAAFELLLTIFEHFEIESWKELLEKIKLVLARPRDYGLDKITGQAATQLKNDVARLTRIPALNTPQSSIDLCSDEPQAVYWSFPGAYDMAGVISRLALFSLFAAADNTNRRPQTWVAIDEFQRCLGNRMDLLFQQSREKLGLILSNQCLADLKTRDKDYASTIKNCVRLHWTFNAADENEQLSMAETSGKVIRKRRTTTYIKALLSTTISTSYQEVETNRYGVNEISFASARPELSIFRSTQDYGFVQFGGMPQVVHTEFHIDKTEYERRKLMPWPEAGEGTITGEMPAVLGPPPPPGPKAINPPTIVNEQRKTRRHHP